MRIINHYLWKFFHICIRIEKAYSKYKPSNLGMIYAYNCFGYGERCFARNGKFYSLKDGSELKNIIRFTELK